MTLKLEGNHTLIYVNGERFNQCKYLAFQINLHQADEYDDIQSIDDMEQQDRSSEFKKLDISPEEEFWGHCSNLQTWFEYDYDTRLLHRNLAFPLLKKLSEIGDPIAKRAYKEEIIYRLEEGNENVIEYLIKGKFLEIFSEVELKHLFQSINSSLAKLAIYGIRNKAPDEYYINFDTLKENIELAKWGVQNNAPEEFYLYFYKLNEDIELAKLGMQTIAPKKFYSNYKNLAENRELVIWGVQNNAHEEFYLYFYKLKEDVELAKLGIRNDAPWSFYKYFDDLKENIKLAKWGIKNKAAWDFYEKFLTISKNFSTFKYIYGSSELMKKYLEEYSKY